MPPANDVADSRPAHDTLRLIHAIQDALSPDLLHRNWRNRGGHPTRGHCYAAAEALYHLLGGKAAGLTPMRATAGNGDTHWWLRDSRGGILDPTAEQFISEGISPPYGDGRGAGFLTRHPSRRAKELMQRLDRRLFPTASR